MYQPFEHKSGKSREQAYHKTENEQKIPFGDMFLTPGYYLAETMIFVTVYINILHIQNPYDVQTQCTATPALYALAGDNRPYRIYKYLYVDEQRPVVQIYYVIFQSFCHLVYSLRITVFHHAP